VIKESIKEHKESLKNRERTYNAMSKTGRYIAYFGFLLFLSSFLTIPLSLGSLVPSSTATQGWVSLFFIGLLVIFIGGAYNRLKGIPQFSFSSDDAIFLKLYDAITSLETYKNDKLELAKYQCLKELNGVRKLMRYYWEPSSITVVMKEIGNEIETFKKRFAKNLIFTLENGIELESVDDTLNEFGEYLIDPSKKKLVDLNKRMDALPHPKEEVESHYFLTDLLKHHQVLKPISVMSLFFALSLLCASVAFYYIHVSTDTAAIVFVTIFGVFAAPYIAYILRRR
jgi:hypothetical protein